MVWVLVRYGRRPLGWARLRRTVLGEALTPDVQRTLITETIGLQVLDGISKRVHVLGEKPYTPPISVIICTREHPELLSRQLQSMTKLIYPKFEIVVVDNAPKTDRTRTVCEQF